MDLPTTKHDVPQDMGTQQVSEENKEKRGILEKASSYIIIATIFLAPIFFIPSAYAPLDVVKSAVISIGVLISSVLCVIAVIKKRSVFIPKGPIIYFFLAIVASIILSTLFSGNIERSLFGQGFEIGTASFLGILFASTFLISSLAYKQKDRIFNVYAAIFTSFIILALFHLTRIIGGAEVLSFGFLSSVVSTVVGKWYDFAIIAGLVGILSLLGIKFLSLGRKMKSILYVILIVSGFFLFAINFSLLWWVIAIIALCIGIFEYFSRLSQDVNRGFFSRISILTLIVLIISVVSAWKGEAIATPLTRALNLQYSEIVLPWQMTLDVTSGTIKESPILGSGPNLFVNQFLKYKPYQAINSSPFFAVEFNNGFATLPSFVTTQGILGLIVWIVFFIFFIRLGIKGLRGSSDTFSKFSLTSSFFASSFLWLVSLLYYPSHVVLFFAFVMTGLYFSALSREGLLNYKESKRAFVISIVALVLLVAWLGISLKQYVALAYFQSGIKELNASQPDFAKEKFNKALFWNDSDAYYRALVEASIIKISSRANEIQSSLSSSGTNPSAEEIEEVGTMVAEALDYADKAISIDSSNHYNHISRARVSELATSLGIQNAYDNAKASYGEAVRINPWNPALYLSLARFETSQNKFTEAQEFLGRALQLKPNYIEAIFLLSQVQVSTGRIKDAITSAQVNTQINPSEPILFFQLGFLQYNDQNYSASVAALEKAVELNNQYANARYFLGLSYSRLGRNADAIAQFEELIKTNPDSQEVAFILSNLKSGRSPFANAEPPIDNKPEERKTLPIDEQAEE